jgi:hypothetical protein
LPDTSDLTDDIMLRSTYKQHFDAVVLDWTYVERRTTAELQRQGRWAFMRNISLLVDFTSGLNLYPDLRLCNNSIQYAQSVARITSVLHKMSIPVNASSHTMVRKTPLFAPFIYKSHLFTKTGSGQTLGKLKKEWRFSQGQMFAADAIIAMHRVPENGRGYCKSLVIVAPAVVHLCAVYYRAGKTDPSACGFACITRSQQQHGDHSSMCKRHLAGFQAHRRCLPQDHDAPARGCRWAAANIHGGRTRDAGSARPST